MCATTNNTKKNKLIERVIVKKGEKKIIGKNIVLNEPANIEINIINKGGSITLRNAYHIKNSGENRINIQSVSLSNALPITQIETELVIEKEAKGSYSSLNIVEYKLNKNAKTSITPGMIIKTKEIKGAEHRAKIKTISEQEMFYYNTRKIDRQDIEELMLMELSISDFLISFNK